jgi:hypothetical protein
VCECGRPSYYKKTGDCRGCYARQYRKKIKTSGRSRSPVACGWFDWIAVELAWNKGAAAVPRKLTEAERAHLVWAVDQERPGLSTRELGLLLGMDDSYARRFAARVRSGAVRVIPRNLLGEPALP